MVTIRQRLSNGCLAIHEEFKNMPPLGYGGIEVRVGFLMGPKGSSV